MPQLRLTIPVDVSAQEPSTTEECLSSRIPLGPKLLHYITLLFRINFPDYVGGVSALTMDTIRVNGETFRERMLREKRSLRDAGKHLTTAMWKDILTEYGVVRPGDLMEIQDHNEPVPDDLREA